MPKAYADAFPASESHLERDAQRLDAVEIDTAFYRSHRVGTCARWAASVPEQFRSAVKLPRTITHERRLTHAEGLLRQFLSGIAGLGPKLGPLLIQLPPSLRFDPDTSAGFLRAFRDIHAGAIVCEPRNTSWFAHDVDALRAELCIARVAADPAPVPDADEPGGWHGLRYERLHGSPKIDYSAYSRSTLDAVAGRLAADATQGRECWCIFDNTAAFAATGDALAARERLHGHTSVIESPMPAEHSQKSILAWHRHGAYRAPQPSRICPARQRIRFALTDTRDPTRYEHVTFASGDLAVILLSRRRPQPRCA